MTRFFGRATSLASRARPRSSRVLTVAFVAFALLLPATIPLTPIARAADGTPTVTATYQPSSNSIAVAGAGFQAGTPVTITATLGSRQLTTTSRTSSSGAFVASLLLPTNASGLATVVASTPRTTTQSATAPSQASVTHATPRQETSSYSSTTARVWSESDPCATPLSSTQLTEYTRWYFAPSESSNATSKPASHQALFTQASQLADTYQLTLVDASSVVPMVQRATTLDEALAAFSSYSARHHGFTAGRETNPSRSDGAVAITPADLPALKRLLIDILEQLSVTPLENPSNTSVKALHVVDYRSKRFQGLSNIGSGEIYLDVNQTRAYVFAHEQAHFMEYLSLRPRNSVLQSCLTLRQIQSTQAAAATRDGGVTYRTPYAAIGGPAEDWAETVAAFYSRDATSTDPTTILGQKSAVALTAIDKQRPGLGQYLVALHAMRN